MALIGTAAGYVIMAMPCGSAEDPGGLAVTAFIGSPSVMAASQAFVLEYWLGGTTAVP
jgi:cobalt/nickel transport system permease protein